VNPFRRKVSFQAVNINDGKIYSFDETLDPKLQGESVVASTSIPVAFAPTSSIGDLQLVDGGVFSDANVQDAVDKCRELVDSDDKIIIDVVMCNTDPVDLGKYEKKTLFNAHHIYERQNTFKTYYATMNDVMEVAKQNPAV